MKFDDPTHPDTPGHFVLVTKRFADGSYRVQDPGPGAANEHPLSDFPRFQLRGAIHLSGTHIPTSDMPVTALRANPLLPSWLSRSNVLTATTEEVGFVATNASIDVTDSSGNHVTSNVAGGDISNIPGSFGFADRLDDDESGAVDSNVSAQVILVGAANGRYRVRVTPTSAQPDSALIYGLSNIANAPQTTLLPYSVGGGASVTFDVTVGDAASIFIAPVSQGFVTLTYVCGKTYSVRNTNGLPLTLQYATVHGPHGGVVVVPARTGTSPYGEAFFTTQSAVGVDLFDGTVLLQSADNGHNSCK